MTHTFFNHKNKAVQLTDDIAETDSPYKVPPHLAQLNETAGALLQKKDKKTEEKLKGWIAENPDIPQLKNYLSVYYSMKGQLQKSFEYNHEIAKQHPGYLFAKINLALEGLENKEPEKVLAALGTSLDLQALHPERKIFHVTEYTGFYKMVFRYFEMTERIDEARSVLTDLEKLEKEFNDDFDLMEFRSLLMIATFKGMTGALAKQQAVEAMEREAPTLPQTEEAPGFHFPQIQWLYQNGFAIERSKVDELLSLERSLLVKDLAAVVRDAIQRYDYFSDIEYKPETHNFVLHALLLLQQLEAHEALPAVLEFLRQPEDLLDFWLSDLITEDTWQVIYATGKNDLPALEGFLKEPLNFTYARSAVSTAISQLVMHHPERRGEAIELYRRLLRFYYENKGNQEVVDYTLNAYIIGDIVDFNGKELTDEMKLLYGEGMADEFIEGEWEDVWERLRTEDAKREFSKKELRDIYAHIEALHKFELSAAKEEEENDYEDDDEYYDDDDGGFTDYEEVNTEGGTLFYSGSEPYKREEKKVGRNDPCPCGSGLKYKKCHGKSE